MRLSQKRILFSTALAKLTLHMNKLGYGVAVDYVKRCEDCPVGRKTSCHKVALAADLNFYDADLRYLDGNHPDTEKAHSAAHDFWDTVGGSKRIARDMNHYSFEHNGMR